MEGENRGENNFIPLQEKKNNIEEGLNKEIREKATKTLGAEKFYLGDGKYNIDKYEKYREEGLKELLNNEKEFPEKLRKKGEISYNIYKEVGEIDIFAEIKGSDCYVFLTIPKIDSSIEVKAKASQPQEMGKLLPDEINELIDLVSESIKDDSKLEDIKSNIEELSKIFTLNNYKMFYSRDLKIYEEKGFQRLGIVDPKINELIMLQQGAGGSHYLQGESKDKKREVKVSNRAIDTGKDGEVIVRFDDENVIWGDIK